MAEADRMTPELFNEAPTWSPAAMKVMEERYLHIREDGTQETPNQMLWRVAYAIATAELLNVTVSTETALGLHDIWAAQFHQDMSALKWLPNSPCLGNAGKPASVQAACAACYVIPLADDRNSIYDGVKISAEIFNSGGGCGYDFSPLREAGARIRNGTASGPVSFMHIFNESVEQIKQGGVRRGAQMGTLRVDHPDIFTFINAKRPTKEKATPLNNFNISVAITDDFMAAVEADAEWQLLSRSPYQFGKPVRTVQAREIWDAIINAAWATGCPGLVFIDRVNASLANPIPQLETIRTSNPCGEQFLFPWDVCNLIHINLGKFYCTEPVGYLKDVDQVFARFNNLSTPPLNHLAKTLPDRHVYIDFPAIHTTVQTMMRFMDNLITVNPIPVPQIKARNLQLRRVGLGVMGWADLLFYLQIPYDSQEARDLGEYVMAFVDASAQYASIELAKERGPFPLFDQSIYRDGPPRRNAAVTSVAPTGCLMPSSLVTTTTGLKPIEQFGDEQGQQWQNISATVFSDDGEKTADRFYVNGIASCVKIKTKHGYELGATLHHRVRTIDYNGNYVWKRMDEFSLGDTVVISKGNIVTGLYYQLRETNYPFHHNSHPVAFPKVMDEDLAVVLGWYMGNGYTKVTGGLHVIIGGNSPDFMEIVASKIEKTFNLPSTRDTHRNTCTVIVVNSRAIRPWFEIQGFAKPKGNNGEGAAGAFVPLAILQSPSSVQAAFVRGLFDTDGCICFNGKSSTPRLSLSSVSMGMIKQVQTILIGLGVMTKIKTIQPGKSHFGKRPVHTLYVLNQDSVRRFRQLVGFTDPRKKQLLDSIGDVNTADSLRGYSLNNVNGMLTVIKKELATKHPLYDRVNQACHTNVISRGLILDLLTEPLISSEIHNKLAVINNFYFDVIDSIEYLSSPTFDISVPDQNTYIANGFISHNSTSIIAGCSAGIEPVYALAYMHDNQRGRRVPIVCQPFQEAMERLGDEGKPILEYALQHGTVTNEAVGRDYIKLAHFQTAHEIIPLDHVRMQAAFQRHLSNACSKTVNLPNEATPDDIRTVYQTAWDLECLGVTCFRDGCKDFGQVLNAGLDQPGATTEPAGTISPTVKQTRPKRLVSYTEQIDTPVGTSYVTIGEHPLGVPFEIFCVVGKAGSDVNADAEALGRLLSMLLRRPYGPDEDVHTRVHEIVHQLENIGGRSQVGLGPNRVRSLPDAIAQVLSRQYLAPSSVSGRFELVLIEGPVSAGDYLTPAENGKLKKLAHPRYDICPQCGQATYAREEGCQKCYSCGKSEC